MALRGGSRGHHEGLRVGWRVGASKNNEPPLGVDQLAADYGSFTNYNGVESDPEALASIDGYVQRGWLCSFDSLEGLTDFVGGTPYSTSSRA